MEDHDPAGRDRLLIAGEAGEQILSRNDADRHRAAVDVGDFYHLYRLGLFPAPASITSSRSDEG
jgi:hypothetical protein